MGLCLYITSSSVRSAAATGMSRRCSCLLFALLARRLHLLFARAAATERNPSKNKIKNNDIAVLTCAIKYSVAHITEDIDVVAPFLKLQWGSE